MSSTSSIRFQQGKGRLNDDAPAVRQQGPTYKYGEYITALSRLLAAEPRKRKMSRATAAVSFQHRIHL